MENGLSGKWGKTRNKAKHKNEMTTNIQEKKAGKGELLGARKKRDF